MMCDIEFRLDSHKNTLHDLSKLTDIICEHTVNGRDDVSWYVEDEPEPKVGIYVYDVTEEQCLLIRDDIRTAEWDGPQPVMEAEGDDDE